MRTQRFSRDMDFLLGKPSRVLECLLDVRRFQVGIVGQNFVRRRAMRDLPNDNGHSNSHAPDAGASRHDFWIERNPFKHASLLHMRSVQHRTAILRLPQVPCIILRRAARSQESEDRISRA